MQKEILKMYTTEPISRSVFSILGNFLSVKGAVGLSKKIYWKVLRIQAFFDISSRGAAEQKRFRQYTKKAKFDCYIRK